MKGFSRKLLTRDPSPRAVQLVWRAPYPDWSPLGSSGRDCPTENRLNISVSDLTEKRISKLSEGSGLLWSQCLCVPPFPRVWNSVVEILTPKGEGISRWGLWKWLVYEGGALKNGFVPSWGETPQSFPASPWEDPMRSLQSRRLSTPTSLAIWSWTSSLWNDEK